MTELKDLLVKKQKGDRTEYWLKNKKDESLRAAVHGFSLNQMQQWATPMNYTGALPYTQNNLVQSTGGIQ